jgi:hypothetical protein
MKYSAKEFYSELKDADRTKLGSKRRKNKRAYSVIDTEDAVDEILTIAENESKFYTNKDAKGAIEFARKQFVRYAQDSIRGTAKEASKIALKELLANWKKEGHI